MFFPVVLYWCESSTIKKAECQRIDAFKTVVLEKILEGSLDCKNLKRANPKEINPEYLLEVLMLKQATILWPPNAKSQLIAKAPDAGKDWRRKEKRVTEDELVG